MRGPGHIARRALGRAAQDGPTPLGLLHCDVPVEGTDIVGDAVHLRGWAHADAGIATVTLTLDGGAPRTAQFGSARPDVAQVLADPSAASPGWQAVISVADLGPGEHTVEIVATGHDGSQQRLRRRFRWGPYHAHENHYDQLDLSGERFDPRLPEVGAIAVEHRARYRLAASLAAGQRVLDAGCGFGYGAATIAGAGARTVDAIDVNPAVVEQARKANASDVRFVSGDIRTLPYGDAAFDLVVCFEVLEHLVEHEALLAEFRRVLAPGGRLLISTPSKGVYPDTNPWHLRELTPVEFEALLRQQFANVVLLEQQLHLATLLAHPSVTRSASAEEPLPAEVLKLSAGEAGEAIYSVALASDARLPELGATIALGDARDELVDAAIASWSERALQAEAEAAMLRTRITTLREYGVSAVDALPAPAPAPPAAETTAALREELGREPAWMYDWNLNGLGATGVGAGLSAIHRTRLELLAPAVREALAAAGPDAKVLDLACCEGWFAHRMLDLGAARVVGIDVREVNIRRATLVRDHLGIDPERLQFHVADVHALPELEPFDVVLMLGLVYHLENPVGAVRTARALTRGLCVVESQLTEQRTPILAGNGALGQHSRRAESFAAWFEEDQAENPLASHGGILSLIPNEAALLAMGRVAGFGHVELAVATEGMEGQYVARERAVMLAEVRPRTVPRSA